MDLETSSTWGVWMPDNLAFSASSCWFSAFRRLFWIKLRLIFIGCKLLRYYWLFILPLLWDWWQHLQVHPFWLSSCLEQSVLQPDFSFFFKRRHINWMIRNLVLFLRCLPPQEFFLFCHVVQSLPLPGRLLTVVLSTEITVDFRTFSICWRRTTDKLMSLTQTQGSLAAWLYQDYLHCCVVCWLSFKLTKDLCY